MERNESAMIEEHDKTLKDHDFRIEQLETENKKFKLQMENFVLENAQIKSGQAKLEGTVTALGNNVTTLEGSVKSLTATVTEDGKETRDLLKTAFTHVLNSDKQKGQLKFRQLAMKEKVILSILGVLGGGGGLLAGIAAIMSALGGK